MSVKRGSQLIAGNLAIRVQDRIFTAKRTMEGSQEYYDIILPEGASLGFTEGTRLMLVVDGVNTTETPILRYDSYQFYIVSGAKDASEIRIGALVDGFIMDFYVLDMKKYKPGTTIPYIYLGRGSRGDYTDLLNTPSLQGRNLEEKYLYGGPNQYTELALPYIEGKYLLFNDKELLKVDTDSVSIISADKEVINFSNGFLKLLKDGQSLFVANENGFKLNGVLNINSNGFNWAEKLSITETSLELKNILRIDASALNYANGLFTVTDEDVIWNNVLQIKDTVANGAFFKYKNQFLLKPGNSDGSDIGLIGFTQTDNYGRFSIANKASITLDNRGNNEGLRLEFTDSAVNLKESNFEVRHEGQSYYYTDSVGKRIVYGNTVDTPKHLFQGNKPVWLNGGKEIALADMNDLASLAIADQFVDILVYSRGTVAELSQIADALANETALVLENNTIYQFDGTNWNVKEALNYNLTSDNGKYFVLEDIDGEHSGEAIWTIKDGGKFEIFVDYANAIDEYTIVRNPSTREIQVAKVPNALTLNVKRADGTIESTTVFDGSSAKTLDLLIDYSPYYTKTEIDTRYDTQEKDKVLVFGDVSGHVRPVPTIVTKTTLESLATIDVTKVKALEGLEPTKLKPYESIDSAKVAQLTTLDYDKLNALDDLDVGNMVLVGTDNFLKKPDGTDVGTENIKYSEFTNLKAYLDYTVFLSNGELKVQDMLVDASQLKYIHSSTTESLSTYLDKTAYETGTNRLGANGKSVDASWIPYSKAGFTGSTVKDFLDLNFAFVDKDNAFTVDQTIKGSPIATQGWVTGTFLPNYFGTTDAITNLEIVPDAPATGNLSLRTTSYNYQTAASSTKDIQIPVGTSSRDGLLPRSAWTILNSVAGKVDANKTGSTITNEGTYVEISAIDTTNSKTTTFKVGKGQIDFTIPATSGVITLSLKETGLELSGLPTAYTPGDSSIVTKGYIDTKYIAKNNIISDLPHWNGKKVVLNGFDFTSITPSGATYTLTGSDVDTGTKMTHEHQFPIVSGTSAGLATAALYNQVEENTATIATLQGQGYVGATLPDNPTQQDIESAWNAAKPTIPSVEGSSLLNMANGETWRKLDVEGTLTWVNLGVLGGTGQATNATTGVVKGSASGAGTISVENDATMTVNGWDELVSDVTNLNTDILGVETSLNNHIADTVKHITTTERQNWNQALTLAQNAIPKVDMSSGNASQVVIAKDDGTLETCGYRITTDSNTEGIPTVQVVKDFVAAEYLPKFSSGADNSYIPVVNTDGTMSRSKYVLTDNITGVGETIAILPYRSLRNYFAPIAHASPNDTYGVANATNYGHVKVGTAVPLASNGTTGSPGTPNGMVSAYNHKHPSDETKADKYNSGDLAKTFDQGKEPEVGDVLSNKTIFVDIGDLTLTTGVTTVLETTTGKIETGPYSPYTGATPYGALYFIPDKSALSKTLLVYRASSTYTPVYNFNKINCSSDFGSVLSVSSLGKSILRVLDNVEVDCEFNYNEGIKNIVNKTIIGSGDFSKKQLSNSLIGVDFSGAIFKPTYNISSPSSGTFTAHFSGNFDLTWELVYENPTYKMQNITFTGDGVNITLCSGGTISITEYTFPDNVGYLQSITTSTGSPANYFSSPGDFYGFKDVSNSLVIQPLDHPMNILDNVYDSPIYAKEFNLIIEDATSFNNFLTNINSEQYSKVRTVLLRNFTATIESLNITIPKNIERIVGSQVRLRMQNSTISGSRDALSYDIIPYYIKTETLSKSTYSNSIEGNNLTIEGIVFEFIATTSSLKNVIRYARCVRDCSFIYDENISSYLYNAEFTFVSYCTLVENCDVYVDVPIKQNKYGGGRTIGFRYCHKVRNCVVNIESGQDECYGLEYCTIVEDCEVNITVDYGNTSTSGGNPDICQARAYGYCGRVINSSGSYNHKVNKPNLKGFVSVFNSCNTLYKCTVTGANANSSKLNAYGFSNIGRATYCKKASGATIKTALWYNTADTDQIIGRVSQTCDLA